MKGLILVVVFSVTLSSSANAEKKPSFERGIATLFTIILVAVAATEAVPDLGLTTEGELALTWQPNFEFDGHWSIGGGATNFVKSERATEWFAEGRYLLGRHEQFGFDFGVGGFLSTDLTWGPRASAEARWPILDNLAEFGVGVISQHDVSFNRWRGMGQLTFRVNWGLNMVK